ncbi:MAG: hypothetical protein ABI047_13585 [Jatrophihabitantaceae bacterium]
MHIGFGVIALSLASAVLDLDVAVGGFLAVCVAVLIGLRDMAEVRSWIKQLHPLLQY